MPRSPLAGFSPEVRRSLPWLVAFRLLTNGALRYTFSFLPALARGSGLSVEQLSQVLALRDLTGVGAPFIGRMADRHSSRRIITLMAALSVVGLLIAAMGPMAFVIGLIVVGLGKIGFDVAMNAWIGESVAYERRGKAMGIVELAWAGSALLLLPILGLLIDHVGWWSASFALGVVGLPLAAVIASQARLPDGARKQPVETRRPLLTTTVVMTLLALALMSVSSQMLIVSHGLWLEDTYGFDATRIGLAVLGIGAVEAVSSVASSTFTDRLGKRNAVLGGMAVMSCASMALFIISSPSLGVGLGLLATAFLGFEFALVSALPLISELDPGARAQTLGLALGLSTIVRAACSVLGILLYVNQGASSLFAVGAAFGFATMVVMATAVTEPVAA